MREDFLKASRPSFWEKLWCSYTNKHGVADSEGDLCVRIQGTVYCASLGCAMVLHPDDEIPDVYAMQPFTRLDEPTVIALCKEHCTEEEIATAQLQYELSE